MNIDLEQAKSQAYSAAGPVQPGVLTVFFGPKAAPSTGIISIGSMNFRFTNGVNAGFNVYLGNVQENSSQQGALESAQRFCDAVNMRLPQGTFTDLSSATALAAFPCYAVRIGQVVLVYNYGNTDYGVSVTGLNFAQAGAQLPAAGAGVIVTTNVTGLPDTAPASGESGTGTIVGADTIVIQNPRSRTGIYWYWIQGAATAPGDYTVTFLGNFYNTLGIENGPIGIELGRTYNGSTGAMTVGATALTINSNTIQTQIVPLNGAYSLSVSIAETTPADPLGSITYYWQLIDIPAR